MNQKSQSIGTMLQRTPDRHRRDRWQFVGDRNFVLSSGGNSRESTVTPAKSRCQAQQCGSTPVWLPNADDCGNFVEQFTFCPESMKRRAKRAVSGTSKKQYRHPLLLAYEFQELLEAGLVNSRAEIARRYGLSRARVTQVMSLLHLPDENSGVRHGPSP